MFFFKLNGRKRVFGHTQIFWSFLTLFSYSDSWWVFPDHYTSIPVYFYVPEVNLWTSIIGFSCRNITTNISVMNVPNSNRDFKWEDFTWRIHSCGIHFQLWKTQFSDSTEVTNCDALLIFLKSIKVRLAESTLSVFKVFIVPISLYCPYNRCNCCMIDN